MSEFGYIPESPEQSFQNNKGIFTPKDIYDLTRADKYTNYGQLELIETQTVSSAVAQVDFTNLGTYNVHFMTFNDIHSVPDNVITSVRFFESEVLETASVYKFAYQYGNVNGSFGESKSTGEDRIKILMNQGNATNETANGYSYFYNLIDSSKYSFTTFQSMTINNQPNGNMNFGSGVLPQASSVTGIRVYIKEGNIASGDISLYGIKEYS
jgi:hypothetical protein